MEANSIQIIEETSANKKLGIADAESLLEKALNIIIFKGKNINFFNIKDEKKDSITPFMLGPTGNLRAPTIIYKNQIIVGFNEDKFNDIFLK